MTEFGKKHQKLKNMYSVSQNTQDVLNESHSWQAIAKNVEEFQNSKPDDKIADDIVFREVISAVKICKIQTSAAVICRKSI